jgi:hypothetical protein
MPRPATEVAERATETVEAKIRELLTPLLAERDQLRAEEADLKEKFDAKRAEVKSVEKVLRSNALIKSEDPPKRKKAEAKGIAPQIYEDLSQAAREAVVLIEEFDGEPFQIGMIEKKTKLSRGTIERAINHLRGEDRLRLLGSRPQIMRDPKAPGGRPAATFQEIK